MKTWKKVLWYIIALIIIAWVISAFRFTSQQNKVKEYSTYCMDAIRTELWEYLESIHMNDSICSEWVCVYMWGVTFEWIDYSYSCKVYNKENVELKLEPLYSEEEIVTEEPIMEEGPVEEETEVNEPEIEEFSTNEDIPVAKMRVVEWQTEEEIQAMIEETCGNMWWTWTDGSCMLEDGSYINF